MPNVVVIGAGAAGLMAAIAAGRAGAQVTVLEYLPAPGRKLLATGAGKCNFTNMLSADEMAERFAPDQRRFVRPALLGFPPEAVREFFYAANVPYTLVDDFYCFPASERAGDILDALLGELRKCGGRVICSAPSESLEIQSGIVKAVRAGGIGYACDAVIAAGGGPGFPELGGRGSLDNVLAKAGIPIVPRVPALCGLKAAEPWWQTLTGIVLDEVTLTLDKKNVTRGTLLFTGEGVSGPAALDMAGRVARLLTEGNREVKLAVNLRPDTDGAYWHNLLQKARRESGTKLVRNLFSHELPQNVANAVCAAAGCSEVIAARLSQSAGTRLIGALTAGTLTVNATESWRKAMASAGGVSRSAVDAKKMRSRTVNNLFFAGECLDVDGPCGGYNLTWAFAAGFLAGNEAAKA